MDDPETHEQRSCLRKIRYECEPTGDQLQNGHFCAYSCGFCNGWHLTTVEASAAIYKEWKWLGDLKRANRVRR